MVTRPHAAWRKNRKREIRRSLGRYLAIMAIVALGVGFFAGLKVTKRAMVETGDAYITTCGMYDERLISTLGLTNDDVTAIGELDGVRAAEGGETVDFLAELSDGTSYVLEAHSISDTINRPSLTAGRLPTSSDECVVDAHVFDEDAIGMRIRVSDENDEDTQDAFACEEYTVVGVANSVCYLNIERGTTKLAGGKIGAFVYLPADGFSLDYYTEIYVLLQNGGEIFSDAYKSAVSDMEQPLTDTLEARSEIRYEDLKADAEDQIADAEETYSDSLDDYVTKRNDAYEELFEARDELQDAARQIAAGWAKLNKKATQLDDAKAQYEEGLAAYEQAESDLQQQEADAEAQFAASQQALDAQRAQLENELAQAQAAGDAVQIQAIQAQLALLDAAQSQLDQQKAAAEAQFAAAEAQLAAEKSTLDAAAQQIEAADTQLAAGRKELSVSGDQLDRRMREYLDSEADAEAQLAEARHELSDAKNEIDDAKADLADLENADCYVLDRTSNIGYSCFENDSSIVDGIARVFPVFFFMVAALVCMTTMARMVEEQRTQIGTLKALGYSNGAIAWKYISYSASAASVGGTLGFFGGTKLFPWVIWQAYGMLYGFAPLVYVLDWKLLAISLAVALLCSAGVTFVSCRTEMTRMPAELMRPKTPKEGKRVLLERVPFIWNRLNFLKKVSIRNVFRYKKRMFMMVLGIGGCTALLLAGMGMRDSIRNIAADQFGNIMKYDFAILFDAAKDEAEMDDFRSETSGLLSECVFVCGDTLEVPTKAGEKTVNVIATGDDAIADMIDLHEDDGQHVDYPPDGSVVISDKLASVAGVSVGDTITVRLSDSTQCSLPVSGIFENYVYHYMLMTPATYESIFGKDCEYESALASSALDDVHDVSARLISDCGASNVTVSADIRDRVSNMMISLDYIVLVVIACAAALAFVVLFNLSNINITERVREIATIKVLGFYHAEVSAYVFRENIVLTVIGAALGLPLGVWLHQFVMSQINFDIVKFKVVIAPASYFIALATTFAFTVTVDLIMRKKLAGIDMVESLKAIE